MKEDKKRLTLEDFKQKKSELTTNLESINGGLEVSQCQRYCDIWCGSPPDCHE